MGVESINRKGFLAELRSLLAFMDPEDRERALRHFERLFDRAGEAGEEELLERLGSPVRQVLEVDREYRWAKKEGRTIYAEELSDEPPVTGESAPDREDKAVVGLTQTVREAAAELEKTAASEDDGGNTDKTSPVPAEELEYEGSLFPEDEVPDIPVLSDRDEDRDEPAFPNWAEAKPRAIGEQKAGAWETAKGEPDSDVERIMQFASASLAENDEEPEEGFEQVEERPGAGRVFAAVLVTVPLILLWIVGLVLSLVLGAAMMAIGFAFCAAGVYFAGYAINGFIAYMPDLLLVCGGALACFALALFFLWFGLWFAVGGCVALVRVTSGIYRGILKKRVLEEEDDE